jgi:hypothetical protein
VVAGNAVLPADHAAAEAALREAALRALRDARVAAS